MRTQRGNETVNKTFKPTDLLCECARKSNNQYSTQYAVVHCQLLIRLLEKSGSAQKNCFWTSALMINTRIRFYSKIVTCNSSASESGNSKVLFSVADLWC